MAKGTIVAKNAVSRKKGKMYFVDGSGNVREVTMNRRGGKKGRHVCKVAAKKVKRKTAAKKKTVAKKTTRKKVAKKRTVRRK